MTEVCAPNRRVARGFIARHHAFFVGFVRGLVKALIALACWIEAANVGEAGLRQSGIFVPFRKQPACLPSRSLWAMHGPAVVAIDRFA